MHPSSSRTPTTRFRAIRRGFAALPTAIASLALLGLLALPSPATAAPVDEEPESEATSISEVEIMPAPAPDGFVPSNSLAVNGTAEPGSTITITVGDTVACSVTAAGDGSWSCPAVLVPNGAPSLTITETDADGTELDSQTRTLRVLGPPTIAGPALGIGVVTGTGYPHSRVTLTATGPASLAVECPVGASGAWTCLLSDGGARPPSGAYQLTARQHDPSNAAHRSNPASRSVELDTANPTAPVLTAPAAEQRILTQPTRYSGTGEPGATVNVFVSDRPTAICTATVSTTGAWTCEGGGVADGTWGVRAMQWDAAGNPGPASLSASVHFGPEPVVPAPADPAPTRPVPQPTAPAPEPVEPEVPGPTSPLVPVDPYWPDFGEWQAAPDRGAVPPLMTWGTPTGFGWFIPTPAEATERGNWLVAPLLGLAFVLLVALPARLLMRLLASAPVRRRLRFTGRNRSLAATADDTPLVKPWVVVTGAVLGAAILAAFTVQILPETRYLRLLAAVAGGIVLLNLVGVALPARGVAAMLRASMWFRLVPSFLVMAAIATVLSKSLNVHPPIIFGVVIATTIPFTVPRAHRGMIAFAQLAALTLLAVGAWFGVAAIGRVDGFWVSISSELLSTVCLAGLGSAVLLTLPIRALPGRILYAWSPWLWGVSTFIIVTVGAAVLMAGTPQLVVAAIAIPAAFTAVVTGAWVWKRHVQPALG